MNMSLEDLLFTVDICRKELPAVHYERLREIERIIKLYYRMKGIIE